MRMHHLVAVTVACLLSGAAPALAQQPAKDDAVIYLSPSASANADGSTPEAGLGSLQAAIDLAQKKFADGYREVTIHVKPGRYLGQQARTAGAGKGHRLVITSVHEQGRAVFDGEDKVDTWLTIPGRVGEPTNMVVSGLTITHYGTAITMNGSRDDLSNAVSHVEIRANFFDAIGQASKTQGQPSTAVIRLVNGDDNQIVGNRFTHFRNAESCSLLHALYVAHHSTGNLIKDNQFADGCGDAIRFRDTSSDNLVQDNRFDDAWSNAPITDWYCDASSRTDCTKRTGECPSVDNRLVGNQMAAHHAPDKGMTAEFGPIQTTMCPAKPDAKRFIVQ